MSKRKKNPYKFLWKTGDLILIKKGKPAPKEPEKPKPRAKSLRERQRSLTLSRLLKSPLSEIGRSPPKPALRETPTPRRRKP